MRKCTSIARPFGSFDEAHNLKTVALEHSNAQMTRTIAYLQRNIVENTKELATLYTVPRRIENVFDSMAAHGITDEDEDQGEPWSKRRRLGPMRTAYKRMNATLAIKKHAWPWYHHGY
jgi:hypothetical protein